MTGKQLTPIEEHQRTLPKPVLGEKISNQVGAVGFSNSGHALRCLERLHAMNLAQAANTGGELTRAKFEILVTDLLQALSAAADPDRVLVDFERFYQALSSEGDQLLSQNDLHRSIEILVTLFAGSQFLTEILLRNPKYLNSLLDRKLLATTKTSVEYKSGAEKLLGTEMSAAQKLDQIRLYQRQELLRIGYCDLLDYLDLPTVILQLSNLADALVQVCLDIAVGLSGISSEGFAVIAMGKLGGQELNYSSDIDLLFLSRSAGSQYLRLGESLIETLARITAEGFLYRVDMRLRPWGKDGSLVSSLDTYLGYLGRHARQWEKQALLKTRFIAGDEGVAREFLIGSLPMLFDAPAESVRLNVHAMKQQTENYLQQKGRGWGEVKLGAGSIRDIEFVVQFLQLAHGAQRTDILTANTLLALRLLKEQKLLPVEDQRTLIDGYVFFRTVEHYLQMMHYQQVSTLPQDEQELTLLARRLGFQTESAGDLFKQRYNEHSKATRQVYLRYFGELSMETNQPSGKNKGTSTSHNADINQHLVRMDPSYQETFKPEEIAQHAEMIRRLSIGSQSGEEDHLVEIEAVRVSELDIEDGAQSEDEWMVTIVAFDYPGELSLICGMLYVFGINIISGSVFTYEPFNYEPFTYKPFPDDAPATEAFKNDYQASRQKIVDVFRVRFSGETTGSDEASLNADIWEQYTHDLEQLLRLMQSGEQREARNQLTRRVALRLSQESSPEIPPLYPIEVTFDNTASDKYTVLQISSQDTIGFLYELTNSLALYQIYIALVTVESKGVRIYDTLFVTSADGKKITDLERQGELTAAILLIKHFTHLLPHSANPESALLHFRGFIEKLQQQPAWFDEVAALERPEVLYALAEVLGVSDFLWEDFLRMQYENLYPVVRDIEQLAEPKSKAILMQEIRECIDSPSENFSDPIYGTGWRSSVNAFKDRELFRADMRNILGYTDVFDQFSLELTELAEVVIETTIRLCEEELLQQYGAPVREDDQPCRKAICALGKCGGSELGFASDIELMFIYSGSGQTDGEKSISSAEFYEKLVQSFLSAMRTRREGIFHIDLQLRPYGKAGSLAVSLPAFSNYFSPTGPAWSYERQALVRLRPICGDENLGTQISSMRDQFVYAGEPFDATSMRAMRERQIRHIVSGGTFNAKYSPGGLLDIEYLVQGLQINHGLANPEVRSPNTRQALSALAAAGLIQQDDYDRLRRALTFLRWLINTLRVVRGNAKDLTVPPYGSLEFEYLTRRLRYGSDVERLREELSRFTGDVFEINQRLLS